MPKNSIVSFSSPLVAGCTVMNDDSPEIIYRPYGMDAWIINCTTSGCGMINRGADRFECVKGDILLFPPHVAHDYTGRGSWTHLWVYFVPRAHWESWLHWPKARSGVLRLPVRDASLWRRISRRLSDVVELFRSTGPDRYEFCMNALEEVLLLCRREVPGAGAGRIDGRVQSALDHIRRNYRSPITVEDLAKAVSLSPSRMAHLFTGQMGVPLRRYLEQYRLTVAREMLISTNRPVKTVADECGFGDPLYFSRVFTRLSGSSPRAFRKQTGRR